jgi:hypothetical protein
VINISEYVLNMFVLKQGWMDAMRALNHQMPQGAVLGFIYWGFMVGITAVASYAIARPRFGPGPKTAVVAAMGYWVIGYLLPTVSLALMGLFPMRLLNIGVVWGLVEIIIATVLGAALYKESSAR